ncbi:MAG: TraB/GumN family protein [Nanoarchaeota archaeon]
MIKIIGTSHISRQSMGEIRSYIETAKPDIIALELDPERLQALFQKQSTRLSFGLIRKVGLKGALFAAFGAWAEKKLGESVGMQPGEEMKLAVRLGRKRDLKIACIDQRLDITLSRFSKALTWKERFRFVQDIVKGIFKPERVPFDLSKVPPDQVIEQLISKVKGRYPNIYCVLIEERNQVMAKNLRNLQAQNPDAHILAIVGAGHRRALERLVAPGISYTFSVG